MLDILKSLFFFIFDIKVWKTRKRKKVEWYDLVITPSIKIAILMGIVLAILTFIIEWIIE